MAIELRVDVYLHLPTDTLRELQQLTEQLRARNDELERAVRGHSGQQQTASRNQTGETT